MPTDTETVGPKWLNFSIRAKEAYVSFWCFWSLVWITHFQFADKLCPHSPLQSLLHLILTPRHSRKRQCQSQTTFRLTKLDCGMHVRCGCFTEESSNSEHILAQYRKTWTHSTRKHGLLRLRLEHFSLWLWLNNLVLQMPQLIQLHLSGWKIKKDAPLQLSSLLGQGRTLCYVVFFDNFSMGAVSWKPPNRLMADGCSQA